MAEEGSFYNDSNRAFLQAFLARSSLTFDEARPILAAIFTTHGRFPNLFDNLDPEKGDLGIWANRDAPPPKRSVGCLRPM